MTEAAEFVEIDWSGRAVTIEYQWVGTHRTGAPLVVFLHEGLGSLSMWRDFPQQFCDAAQCRGLVYSRPGYGQSTPRAEDEVWGVDYMHRQAYEVLPALLRILNVDASAQPLWLLGHSDGASIALLYAARHSAELAGLMVLAPHTFVEEISVTSIAAARSAYLNTDLPKRLGRYHANPDSAFWGWNRIWLDAEFRRWSIQPEVATIRCPVLAVQGLDDEYGTLEQVHSIERNTPHTELLALPHCGHSPHRDQTEQLLQASRLFMQRQAPLPALSRTP
jgi:pimeloyl-ACP methyl ester carboxylesterase